MGNSGINPLLGLSINEIREMIFSFHVFLKAEGERVTLSPPQASNKIFLVEPQYAFLERAPLHFGQYVDTCADADRCNYDELWFDLGVHAGSHSGDKHLSHRFSLDGQLASFFQPLSCCSVYPMCACLVRHQHLS